MEELLITTNIFAVLTNNLHFYFAIVIIPIGVGLNLISLLIFCRKALNKSTNWGLLNGILCFFDILALSNSTIIDKLLPYFNVNLTNMSELLCKLLNIWKRLTLQSASMQQLLITFMFYMNVKYPNRFRLLQKKENLFKIVALMIFGIIGFNIQYLFFDFKNILTFDQYTNTTQFVKSCTGSLELLIVSDFINIFLVSILPFSCMLTLNVLIIKQLVTSRSKFQNGNLKIKDLQFFKLIITINFLFLIVYLPWTVSQVLNYIFGFIYYENFRDKIKVFSYLELYQSVSTLIAYLFNISPFFINLTFNRLFKRELSFIICSFKKIKNGNRISSISFITK